MTFIEALEVLGLSDTQPVTQDAVRKAYVALIKVHKPERDPDGFQRVREAYDRAKEVLNAHEQAFVGQQLPLADPRAEVPASSLADTEALRTVQEAVDQAEDEFARIPLLVSAIAQHPRETSLRWQLVDAYNATRQLPLSEATLCEGAELGLPGFLKTITHNAPTITQGQFEMLRSAAPLTLILRDAVARKDQAALTNTLRTLESTQDILSRKALVNLALYALEREDIDSASRVLEFVKENHSRLTREPGSQIAEACARDLVVMRDKLPHTYLKAFVQGVRFGQANDNVILYRQRDPELADEVYAVLQKHSEPLAKMYGPMLPSKREVQARGAPGNGRWRWGVLIAAIVGALLRFVVSTQNVNSHTSQPIDITERLRQRVASQSENAPAPIHTEPSMSYPILIATLEEQHASVVAICRATPQHCVAAEALQQSAEAQHCALTDARNFARTTRGLEPRAAFQAVHHAALRACGVDTRGGAR